MSENFINGKYTSGYLKFNYGDHAVEASIKTPSLLERIFTKTVRIELKDDNQTKSVRLKQTDIQKFLESNDIEVSPYLSKTDLVKLFCDAVNQKEIQPVKKTLTGACLNGRITLDAWKDDANGISVASFWQRLFVPTTKLRIQEGKKFYTYTVVRKNLIKSALQHGINVNQKTSNPLLIEKIKEQVAAKIQFKPETPKPDETQKPVYALNAVKGQLLKTTAASSFTKTGEKIEERVSEDESLLLADLMGSQFALTIYPENSIQVPNDPIFLQVDHGTSQKNMYIDAQELADRYHLSLAEVKAQAQEGKLAEFLATKTDKIALLDQILTNYERMFDKQEKLKKGTLSPSLLMKLVRTAVKNRAFNKEPTIEGKPYLEEGHSYFPLFRDKKLHIVQLHESLALTPGSFAQVSKVYNPISRHEKVLKVGIPAENPNMPKEAGIEYARKALENEYELLHFLHKDFPGGKIPGIQKAPHAVTVFTSEGAPTGVLLTTAYDYDLFTALGLDRAGDPNLFKDMDIDQRLDAFYPLLKGFEYCVTHKNLGHGDIKLENILVKDGQLDIADFGDARILGKDKRLGTTTARIAPVADMILLGEEGSSITDFNLNFIMRDVYALGDVLFTLLTDKYEPYGLGDYDSKTGPYDPHSEATYTPEGYPPLHAPFQRHLLEDQGVPEAIIEIAEGMTKLNPDERMDITEVLEKLEAYRTSRGLPLLTFPKKE
jgi:serine/threonine protein kinase